MGGERGLFGGVAFEDSGFTAVRDFSNEFDPDETCDLKGDWVLPFDFLEVWADGD